MSRCGWTDLIGELERDRAANGVVGERSDDRLLSARLQSWGKVRFMSHTEMYGKHGKMSGRTSGSDEAGSGDKGDSEGEDGEAHLG